MRLVEGTVGDGTGRSQIQRCLDWSLRGWDDPSRGIFLYYEGWPRPSKSSRHGSPFSTSYRCEQAPPLHRHRGAWAVSFPLGRCSRAGTSKVHFGRDATTQAGGCTCFLGVQPISTRGIHNLWIFRRSFGVCFFVSFLSYSKNFTIFDTVWVGFAFFGKSRPCWNLQTRSFNLCIPSLLVCVENSCFALFLAHFSSRLFLPLFLRSIGTLLLLDLGES